MSVFYVFDQAHIYGLLAKDKAIVATEPFYKGEKIMLELRPLCECCAKELPPQSEEAMICTFECTFCSDCNDELLQGHVQITVAIW